MTIVPVPGLLVDYHGVRARITRNITDTTVELHIASRRTPRPVTVTRDFFSYHAKMVDKDERGEALYAYVRTKNRTEAAKRRAKYRAKTAGKPRRIKNVDGTKYERTCIHCGVEFITQTITKVRCKPGCRDRSTKANGL